MGQIRSTSSMRDMFYSDVTFGNKNIPFLTALVEADRSLVPINTKYLLAWWDVCRIVIVLVPTCLIHSREMGDTDCIAQRSFSQKYVSSLLWCGGLLSQLSGNGKYRLHRAAFISAKIRFISVYSAVVCSVNSREAGDTHCIAQRRAAFISAKIQVISVYSAVVCSVNFAK